MSAPWIAIVLVAFASVGFLAVITAGLVRSALRLGKAMLEFAAKAAPIADDVGAEAARAAEHAADLAERSPFRRT